jgi:hypothetical protein
MKTEAIAHRDRELAAAFLRVQRAVQAVEGGYVRLELPAQPDDVCDWTRTEEVLRFLEYMTAELGRAAEAMLPAVQALRADARAARSAIAGLEMMASAAPVPTRRRRRIVVDWREAP